MADIQAIETDLNFWGSPIIQFLENGVLPTNVEQAKKLRRSISFYVLVRNQLYRRSLAMPLLKCLDNDQSAYTMSEVHKRVCESHMGGRSLATKILRASYYWMTMRSDYLEHVRRCEKCQKFVNAHHSLLKKIT